MLLNVKLNKIQFEFEFNVILSDKLQHDNFNLSVRTLINTIGYNRNL